MRENRAAMESTSGLTAASTKETSKMVSERAMESGRNHQETAINMRDITLETKSKATGYFPGPQATSTKDITGKI